jgi:hypothetical protein
VDREFLAWIWNYRREVRPRTLAVVAEHGKDVERHVLTSPRAVRKFLAGL